MGEKFYYEVTHPENWTWQRKKPNPGSNEARARKPGRRRLALILRHKGHTYREIAETFGVSVAVARSIVQKTEEELRASFHIWHPERWGRARMARIDASEPDDLRDVWIGEWQE